MTTITELREIAEHTRDLANKRMKTEYLNQQSRDVLNFLGGNININGIGPEIFQEIFLPPIFLPTRVFRKCPLPSNRYLPDRSIPWRIKFIFLC